MSVARLAATVIVLRPAPSGAPEILMVRRTRAASFMADAFVFPGGRVDETDRGSDGDPLGAFRAAAVRELFEEAQVRCEAASLVPLSRWVTPSMEPKRFDACFFVTGVPAGTEAKVDETEVTELLWANAEEVLRRQAAGQMKLPPPTLRTLDELRAHRSIDEALRWASSRPLTPIQPKLVAAGEHMAILLPWHPDFASAPGEGEPIPADSPLGAGAGRYILRDGRFWAE